MYLKESGNQGGKSRSREYNEASMCYMFGHCRNIKMRSNLNVEDNATGRCETYRKYLP